MATILLVEDVPDLGLYEALLLEASGHRVLRCSGGPTPFAACPMMRRGSCPLPDSADLIIFSSGLFTWIRHRSYRGDHLLRTYRNHPRYGALPMLLIARDAPGDLAGSGRLETVDRFSHPRRVLEAIQRLLAPSPKGAQTSRRAPKGRGGGLPSKRILASTMDAPFS
jgi:hypothetical protein